MKFREMNYGSVVEVRLGILEWPKPFRDNVNEYLGFENYRVLRFDL
jgi:hypothetical protein